MQKTMIDELCFVQFLHPGHEHQPDREGSKDWNTNGHKRNFLRCQGRRFGVAVEEPLHFWAEWEPESEVLETIAEPIKDGPEFLYKPYYIFPISYAIHQNTDPFVFGKNFLYTVCQQHTEKGPTQLRFLERGSVILFGSCLRQSFRLDTVFVVDKWVDHTATTFRSLLRDVVPQEHMEVTLLPLYQGGQDKERCGGSERSWRLYYGASPDDPVQGMFSFFPCQPAEQSPRGFAKPTVAMPSVITDNLLEGKRLNPGLSIEQVRHLFLGVRGQVESAGLSLGVYAELPERRAGLP